ncbi:MAG TPA: hemolysin family protein [Candidatus Sulfomarinibacteraceae bacterium]|nr:hemolysin family protein [Candidatus Sulfomarinibacteraceae bacterium]
MALLIPFAIILILVLLNGLFVAAEFAIIGVRRTRIAQLAKEDNSVARRLLKTLDDRAQVDRYIASAQLGITLASLGLGMYGEPAIAHLLEGPLHDWFGLEGNPAHTVSFIIGLSVVTYLHVVVGEMVPKSLALQFAERTVLTLARPMALMQKLLGIPITVLNQIGLWVLQALGVPPPEEKSRLHTPDELEMIISEGVVGGLIDAQDSTLFENIFDLSELRVRQMMTPRVKVDAIPVTIGEEALAKKFTSSPYARFPVYEGDIDHIVGVLHLKDFVIHEMDGTPFDLRQLMHEPVYLPESASAYELLSTLETKRTHMAIVVGEFGGTAGIVTLEDLLEEVVGEVWDEFDVDLEEPVTVLAPGHLLMKGTTRLHEVQPYVNLDTHADLAGSIAGLMLSHVDLPPRRGDTVELGDIVLRIENVEGMTIESVAVHFPASRDATKGN